MVRFWYVRIMFLLYVVMFWFVLFISYVLMLCVCMFWFFRGWRNTLKRYFTLYVLFICDVLMLCCNVLICFVHQLCSYVVCLYVLFFMGWYNTFQRYFTLYVLFICDVLKVCCNVSFVDWVLMLFVCSGFLGAGAIHSRGTSPCMCCFFVMC